MIIALEKRLRSRPQNIASDRLWSVAAMNGKGWDNRNDAPKASGGTKGYSPAMSDMNANFVEPDRVRRYTEQGPPAFAPGHGGMLQMTGILLAERMPADGQVLVVGAGGGLETRYLAGVEPEWRFVGVDPAVAMLDLARETAGSVAGDRLSLIEGTVADAPIGPFDSATCILVIGLIPDDGSKLAMLIEVHNRLKSGAPFILVDQCIDSTAPDLELRLDRYANYAARSGVDADTIAGARKAIGEMKTMVPAHRDEQLLSEAGFRDAELFYVGMAWRGWVCYADHA